MRVAHTTADASGSGKRTLSVSLDDGWHNGDALTFNGTTADVRSRQSNSLNPERRDLLGLGKGGRALTPTISSIINKWSQTLMMSICSAGFG